MKKVVPPDMVAHLWAHQSQDEARNSTGNFYFTGRTIFSYGGHFPIARIETRKGKTVCLFTTRGYSSTTAQHKSCVRHALRNLHPVFECLNVMPVHKHDAKATRAAHKGNLQAIADDIADTSARALRARAGAALLWAQVEHLVKTGNSYAEFFGLKQRFTVPDSEDIKERIEKQKRIDSQRRLKAREKDEQAAKEAGERLQRWLGGESIPSHQLPREEFARLRIRNDELETSQGAIVPLAHALRILPYLRSGEPYQHNGHSLHVGQFRIDSIDAEGNLTAGCHKIKREEIERIAAQIV